MEEKKLLLVQPHSDDILFSCFHLLIKEDVEVQVLTVENDPRRIEEDQKLYDFLNIPFHHLNLDFKDESYYGFKKEYPEVNLENTYAYLQKYFGKETMNEIEMELVEWIRRFLKKNKGYTIVAPWGIGHPFHFFVKKILENTVGFMYYYREFPHSYKRRAQSQVAIQSNPSLYMLYSSVDVKEFHEAKWKLASKFYRSQSGLLFYEMGYIKKQLPEEIYVKDDLPF
jgi:LmbE family N-acetylglucosaminyl deacetylase